MGGRPAARDRRERASARCATEKRRTGPCLLEKLLPLNSAKPKLAALATSLHWPRTYLFGRLTPREPGLSAEGKMLNDNVALGRRWFEEVWNQKKSNSVPELLAADAVMHGISESCEEWESRGLPAAKCRKPGTTGTAWRCSNRLKRR